MIMKPYIDYYTTLLHLSNGIQQLWLWNNHTRDIYVALRSDLEWDVCKISIRQRQDVVNALIMSGLPYPPNARQMQLKIILTTLRSAWAT